MNKVTDFLNLHLTYSAKTSSPFCLSFRVRIIRLSFHSRFLKARMTCVRTYALESRSNMSISIFNSLSPFILRADYNQNKTITQNINFLCLGSFLGKVCDCQTLDMKPGSLSLTLSWRRPLSYRNQSITPGRPATLLKKRLWRRYFSANFAKFLRKKNIYI